MGVHLLYACLCWQAFSGVCLSSLKDNRGLAGPVKSDGRFIVVI